MKLRELFRKPLKKYKEVVIRLPRYESPKISLGYNKIGESKRVKLKDLIVDEQDGLCKIDDSGMIGYSPLFRKEALNMELVANYGYISRYFFNLTGEKRIYFKSIEELMQRWLSHVMSLYSDSPVKYYNKAATISVLKNTEIPFIMEFLQRGYSPLFLDNNFNILDDRKGGLIGYSLYGGLSSLPLISYGAFYEKADGNIVHANYEQLLITDCLKVKACESEQSSRNCVKIDDNLYYKDDFKQFSDYEHFTRAFRAYTRDRKINAIFSE